MSFPVPLMRAFAAGILLVAALAGCGEHRSAAAAVRTEVVSGPGTRSILVLHPEAEGRRPIVVAYHGSGGDADQMRALGRRLAERGFVVFAPNWRTDLSSQQGVVDAARDAECGYRYARRVAHRYGGDLRLPVTFVGWSLGALFAVQAGLEEHVDPTGRYVRCFTEVPRPNLIVAVDGCYYETPDGGRIGLLDPTTWRNPRTRVSVVVGERDQVCPARQSRRLSTDLRARGYAVRYTGLPGADHFAPVFLGQARGRWTPAPGASAGEKTVETVVGLVKAARAG